MFAQVVGAVTAVDGTALGGVALRLVSNEQTLETTSDQDGGFAFEGSPVPGTWEVTASIDGYEPFTQAITGLRAGEKRSVRVTLSAVVVARVVGTVWTYDGYGDPDIGDTVHILLISDEQTLETTSDYDGEFAFENVAVARAWTLSIDLEGHEPFTQTLTGLTADEERSVDVLLTEIDPAVPFHLQTGSEVGQRAPDFTLPDATGDLVALSSYQGKSSVLLAFHRGVF